MKTIAASLAILIALIVGLLYYNGAIFSEDSTQKYTELMQAGDNCVNISENAASKLVAVVEYQKLEIAGRKSRVLLNCMNDHGYVENPAWEPHEAPSAKASAAQTGASYNEVIENMRRKSMLVFTEDKNTPIFWVKAKAAPAK